MPRPAKPAPGDEIVAEFGASLVEYAKEQLRFHRVPSGSHVWDLNGVTGTATVTELELTRLPANDPKVKYAVCGFIVRAGTGENVSMTLRDGDGTDREAGLGYATGNSGLGGMHGPFLVRVGGTNGRSIKWSNGSPTASTKAWIVAVGWMEAE